MAEDINAPPKKLDLRFDEWLFRFWAKYQGVQVLANLLSSLGNGIIAKTGTGAFSARTVTGTTNQITVTNGDGVSGNPTISLPSAITTPGSLTTTTDLTVNGNGTIGDTGSDLLEVKAKTEFDLNLDSYVSIDGETSRTNGLGFFFGTLNYSNATGANYQIFTRPNVSVAKTNWRAVSIRSDSPVTSTGLISTVSTLEVSGGPSWLGTAPTNWRQITIGDVTVATNTYGIYNSIASGTNKWGYYGIGTAQNYMEGSLGIGIDNSADSQLRISKAISGANTSYLGYYSGAVQSTVATSAVGMRVRMDTQAASFTLPLMTGFLASQGTIGATSAVTTQYGFHANSTLIGATNNYGFYSDIASASNRWNFFANGTANNAFAGNSSFGKATAPTVAVDVSGGFLDTLNGSNQFNVGGSTSNSVAIDFRYTSSTSTATSNSIRFIPNITGNNALTTFTANAIRLDSDSSFTGSLTNAIAQNILAVSAATWLGSVPTNWRQLSINDVSIAATNIYGVYEGVTPGTGKWGYYGVGGANNAFSGNTRFGALTAPTVAVDVTGAILATTSIRSSGQTAGVGYTTGAGGTVTQGSGSGKATGVTLNRVCGQITMDSATLNAATSVSFTFTNSAIADTDVVNVNIDSGATADSYIVNVTAVAAGSCRIQLYNFSASNLGEAIVLNFAVIKAVSA